LGVVGVHGFGKVRRDCGVAAGCRLQHKPSLGPAPTAFSRSIASLASCSTSQQHGASASLCVWLAAALNAETEAFASGGFRGCTNDRNRSHLCYHDSDLYPDNHRAPAIVWMRRRV